MRKVLVVACLAAVVGACASESAQPSGPCAKRNGSYRQSYVERSGTCGAPGERIIPAGPQPTSVDAPCTGSISYSSDNCEVTFDATCPEDGIQKGARLRETGKSRWNANASEGTATVQWTVTDANGKTLCISTYDVTLTAL